MTRRFYLTIVTLILFATELQGQAKAQVPVLGKLVGPGGNYTGYGQGAYGYGQGEYRGYGRGYNYSGFGNGPYGYGSGSTYHFPRNGGYGYFSGRYYDGYGSVRYRDVGVPMSE